MMRTLVRFAVSGVMFLAFMVHSAGWAPVGMLERIEQIIYDARVVLTMPGTVDERVVIVDIDERSIAAEGQWTWPRSKLADMVDQLFDRYHIRALGFDMTFPEPDGKSPRAALAPLLLLEEDEATQALMTLAEALDTDRRFADAIKGRPVVLGYVFKQVVREHEPAILGALGPPLMDEREASQYPLLYIKPQGYTGNIAGLQEVAETAGFFDNPLLDADGTYRRVPLVQLYEGRVYPALALELTRVALGQPPVAFEFDPPHSRGALNLERIRVGPVSARLDQNVGVYVPYRGYQGSFPYVSATDVIQGTADPDVLRDAIVLVGTTAPGLLDLRVTPVQNPFAGVEVHANIVSGMLDGSIKQKAPYYIGIEVVQLLLVAVILALAAARLSPVWGAVTAAAVIAAIVGGGFALWQHANLIVPVGTPVVFTVLLFLLHTMYGYFVESRGKRSISRLFGQYVPPELVEEMAEHPEAVSMEGESRDMTVLFSDVRGFTSISEKLDARELSELMNLFLTPLTEVIHNHRGTIDKYMGDAIMAFWGAPLPDPEHARHALEAAVDMARAVRRLDDPFEARGWAKLHIGVGLNTGLMRVGNMGSEFRMAYTVMGDAVNLGSRLEGLTKEYGVVVICSEHTRDAVQDWTYRELDLVRVKGKDKPVGIFEPIGPKNSVPKELRQEITRHRQALVAYRNQAWDEAERDFFSLSRQPDAHKVYSMFLERIAFLRANPPGADWDGAFTFQTK